ncbi:MAG: exo-alpha-sialidase [Nitrosopumilus sp.]|nr:exo-alpha-sialidase [Nitrosopumilus sp.]
MLTQRKITCFFLSSLILLSPIIAYDGSLLQLSYSQPQQSQQENNTNTFTIDNISDNVRDSVYPQTESSGNNVYVVWQDNMFGLNRQNYDILLKTSTDGGQTFGDVINLSNNSGFSEHPQIAVNGSNVYIIWADNTSLNRDIYFVSSTDGGQTFGDVVNLSNNAADSYNHEISVSGSNVYVTWLDSQKYVKDDGHISFVSSKDGGQTFGDVINLANNAGKSSFPKISSFGDNVYLAWNIDREDPSIINTGNTTDGIFFIKSTDNGNSFDKEIRITADQKPGEVQIAAEVNNVYVIWGSPDPSTTTTTSATNNAINNLNRNESDSTAGDGIYFVKSTDNGNSFTKPSFVKDQFQNPLNVEIIEHLGDLIIAIQATPRDNTIEGNQDIFLMKSQDGGSSFTKAINVSNNPGISECPSMTIPSSTNNLVIVWQDKSTGNNEALSTKILL